MYKRQKGAERSNEISIEDGALFHCKLLVTVFDFTTQASKYGYAMCLPATIEKYFSYSK